MARLTVVKGGRQPSNTNLAAHRASATEGEAARKLLEAQGFIIKGGGQKNGQFETRCPFHEGPGSIETRKGTNFYVNSTNSVYTCHSAACGERGNLQTLERFFGVDVDDDDYVAAFNDRDSRLKEFERNLTTALRTPFYEHGLTDATIERFRLGFEPNHVNDDGKTIPDRYVIPYLEGRRPKFFRYYQPDGDPKYKYTWEQGAEGTLFNAQDAMGDEQTGTVYLCEGEQKAMMLVQLGYAACAVPGAGIWKDEFQAAFTHARKIIICFDNDNPLHHNYDKPDEGKRCQPCAGKGLDRCAGHNPGQDAAVKRLDDLGWRAKNVVLPWPNESVRKTDINDFFMRDGNTNNDFCEIATGKRKTQYQVQTLADIEAAPPEEAQFLIANGILPQAGRLLIAGKPKVGKAQPLSTPVLTPTGWSTMGDLQVGSEVVGSDGRPTRVTHLHPQGEKEVFRIELSDGSATLACADHLWLIQSHNDRTQGRPGRVVDTMEVKCILEAGKGRSTYVPMSAPIEFAPRELPLSAYALGLLLGDGGFRQSTPTFTSEDVELFEALATEVPVDVRRFGHLGSRLSNGWGQGANPVTTALRELGLWGHKSESKFIPEMYLRSSVEDRLALLQGLMDTDGGMTNNSAQFYSSSRMLADGVVELVRSLGGTASLTEKETTHLRAYRVTMRLPAELGCPFRLARKCEAWGNGRAKRMPSHRIVSVTPAGREEAQCITVEASDHLYVTEDFILTHNSIFADNLVLSLASGIPFLNRFEVNSGDPNRPGVRTLLLDRELSKWSLYNRLQTLIADRPGYRAASENLLIDHDHMLRLDQPNAYDVLANLVEQNGAQVVCMDTAYKFLGGDVESSGALMKAFDVLDRVLHATGVSIVMTHHLKKGPGGRGKENTDIADPDGVAGSFLWTGWPNATILLNYLNRSVENPYNSVCTFTAFRDSAAPEPLALYRSRESISYNAIEPFSHEDAAAEVGKRPEVIKPTTQLVSDLLLECCPTTEDDFLHIAAGRFGVSIDTVRPYYIDAMSTGYFEKTGKNPPILKFIDPAMAALPPEKTWESDHGLAERPNPADKVETVPLFDTAGLS